MNASENDKNNLKQYAICMLLFLFNFNAFGDGSAQLERQGKPVKIFINGGGSRFGGYRAAPNEKINFYITSPSTEAVYIGFGATFKGNSSIPVDAYFKITNAAGAVKFGPERITPAINSIAQATAGPFTGGYTPIIFNPTDTGVYSLEVNEKNGEEFSALPILIDYLDITVADKASKAIKPGRISSKSWVLSSANETTESYSKFIVSTSPGAMTEIDLNGLKGAILNVFINASGHRTFPSLANNIMSIKKFANYNPSLDDRYRVYLTQPDYLQGSFQNIVFSEKPQAVGCSFLGYKFKLRSPANCYAEVYLDLNGIPGYQEDSRDVKYIVNLKVGANEISWDGKDSRKNPVDAGTNVKLEIKPIYGFANLPLFNTLSNSNGLIVKNLKSGTPDPKVYWDDSLLYDSYARFNQGVRRRNYEGCVTSGCHVWGDLIQDASGTKMPLGKDAIVNTWWYASSQGVESTFNFEGLCIPIVGDDVLETPQNTEKSDKGIYTNDTYYSPYVIIAENGTTEKGGRYSLDSNGLVYIPKINYSGIDQLKYRVCLKEKPELCDTGLVTINITPGPVIPDILPEITIPSGFSPNDDAVNDYFKVTNLELYKENKVKIYSRWGDLVYEATGYDNENVKWIGTSSRAGLPGKLPAGTYYYVIDKGDGSEPKKSFVILFR